MPDEETPLSYKQRVERMCEYNPTYMKEVAKGREIELIDVDNYGNAFVKWFHVKTPMGEKITPFVYTDGIYERLGKSLLQMCCNRAYGNRLRQPTFGEIVFKVNSYSMVEKGYFDNIQREMLNVQNGVLNLETREFYEQSPIFKFTTKLPVIYNPNAKYDFFETFVNQLVEPDDALVIQEMFGYCLYRDYFIQKAVLLYGEGRNGKDTLLYCLLKLLGEINCSAVNLIRLTADRFTTAELHHKYANISSETPKKKIESADIFKALRGGTFVEAEVKYGDHFRFINYAKMIFSANNIPKTDDYSYAFWRSWILIQFANKFKGDKDNKQLRYELTTPERLSGILNFALVGLKRLLENQCFSTSTTAEQTEHEWMQQADSVREFILECVELLDSGTETSKMILDKYHNYCDDNGLKPDNNRAFWMKWNNRMKHIYPEAKRKQFSDTKERYWSGIRVNEVI